MQGGMGQAGAEGTEAGLRTRRLLEKFQDVGNGGGDGLTWAWAEWVVRGASMGNMWWMQGMSREEPRVYLGCCWLRGAGEGLGYRGGQNHGIELSSPGVKLPCSTGHWKSFRVADEKGKHLHFFFLAEEVKAQRDLSDCPKSPSWGPAG